MNPRRTAVNLITFLVITGLLTYVGVTRFLFPEREGRTLVMMASDASGLLPRSDVTVRGVPAGSVTDVRLTDQGTARVTLLLEPGVTISEGTKAEITRRSPIGDITVNLTPGRGAAMADGGTIPAEDVVVPPDPIRTIEALSQTLSALTPEDLSTVTEELATALRGRGQDLADFAVAAADLQERILEVRIELESLIRTGPEVLDVLAENAPTLADDIRVTAILADILRDRRFDLVELTRSGASFAEVFGRLLESEKANLACVVQDFGRLNKVLAEREHLEDLVSVLELNHFFFGGADQTVLLSTHGEELHGRPKFRWFRVHLLLPQQPHPMQYAQQRRPPDVFAGNGCHTRYGDGVGPATQPVPPFLAQASKLHPGK
jgi:phospholipid/cholesterol/gamma-HCH transport system substrate-binding protein